MKRHIAGALSLGLALGLLLTGCAPTQITGTPTTPAGAKPVVDDKDAVRTAFETYTSAALSKDGDKAVSVLATPVLSMYADAAKHALSSPEETVAGLPISLRMTVYVLRAEIDAATLRTAKPKDLVKVAIDKGLVGEDGISNLELGDVTVNGDSARAAVRVGGRTAPFKFEFLREDGAWKVDLKPLLELVNGALVALAKERNMTIDQLIDQTLVIQYGPAKAAEIRKPLGG